jgi:hypothetical protein
MTAKNLPKYKKFDVSLPTGDLTLYAGQKVLSALEEVTTEMTLYEGVRLAEVMKAVYEQGLKDGRRDIIEQFDQIKGKAKYLPPGRPKKVRRNSN